MGKNNATFYHSGKINISSFAAEGGAGSPPPVVQALAKTRPEDPVLRFFLLRKSGYFRTALLVGEDEMETSLTV